MRYFNLLTYGSKFANFVDDSWSMLLVVFLSHKFRATESTIDSSSKKFIILAISLSCDFDSSPRRDVLF
jgi:hypothetical protein